MATPDFDSATHQSKIINQPDPGSMHETGEQILPGLHFRFGLVANTRPARPTDALRTPQCPGAGTSELLRR
jgi:hypothetical protein